MFRKDRIRQGAVFIVTNCLHPPLASVDGAWYNDNITDSERKTLWHVNGYSAAWTRKN